MFTLHSYQQCTEPVFPHHHEHSVDIYVWSLCHSTTLLYYLFIYNPQDMFIDLRERKMDRLPPAHAQAGESNPKPRLVP